MCPRKNGVGSHDTTVSEEAFGQDCRYLTESLRVLKVSGVVGLGKHRSGAAAALLVFRSGFPLEAAAVSENSTKAGLMSNQPMASTRRGWSLACTGYGCQNRRPLSQGRRNFARGQGGSKRRSNHLKNWSPQNHFEQHPGALPLPITCESLLLSGRGLSSTRSSFRAGVGGEEGIASDILVAETLATAC